jgi:hypothetical protein
MESFIYIGINQTIRDKDYNKVNIYGPIASVLGYILNHGNSNMDSVLNNKFTAYRGALLKKNEMKQYVPGSTVVLRGFTSTSLQKNVANKYSVNRDKD